MFMAEGELILDLVVWISLFMFLLLQKPVLMAFLLLKGAQSPQAGAPARSPWHCYICGGAGSVVKALGCQFTRPISLWSEALKSRTGWPSLLYLESKVLHASWDLRATNAIYRSFQFKGHRPSQRATEMSNACILNEDAGWDCSCH